MNRYLLDTHVLLWWLDGGERLSKRSYKAIQNIDNTVFVSAAVTWEVITKRAKGHLNFQGDILQEMQEQTFLPLPITHTHAKCVETLSNIHKDPFDRIMIAQALVEDLTFITKDNVILHYPEIQLLKA